MCEQCFAKTDGYLPNEKEEGADFVKPHIVGLYYLCRATQDGDEMKNGDWGLVKVNDPTFVFTTTPWPNPFWELSDDNLDNLPKKLMDIDTRWEDDVDKFHEELMKSVSGKHYGLGSIAQLVQACLKSGIPEKDLTRVHRWLFQYIGELLAAYPNPTTLHLVDKKEE